MAYRGQNSVANTVQYWNGTRWLEFANLTLTTSGTNAVLTALNGALSLVANGAMSLAPTGTLSVTSVGTTITTTTGNTIIQSVGGGASNISGASVLLQGQTTTATVTAQTNLVLTASTGTVSITSVASTVGITAATGMTLSTGANTLAISGPTVSLTATTLILDGGTDAFIWPGLDGDAGDVLTTDGAGNLSFQPGGGSGITYLVELVSADPAPTAATLEADEITYAADLSSAAFSITLPAAMPASGTRVVFKDATGDGATRNLTIVGNGNNIDGAASAVIATNYGSLTLQSIGPFWIII